MLAKNKIDIIPHQFPDRFLIKVYPNEDNTCDIIVARLDTKRLWDLNLQFKLYNKEETDYEIITIGSSKTFFKIIKNYKTTKINLY